MAGVISFSNGSSWFIGGWGWRALMEPAVEQATSPEDKRLLESRLYTQGLSFELLDLDERKRVAKLVSNAARLTLAAYAQSSERYEASYVERLGELLTLLDAEAKGGS